MEGFYKASSSIDIIELQELLARKYNIDYILSLEAFEGLAVIEKALNIEVEDKLWDRWLVEYSNMTKDTFVNFNEYKNQFIKTNFNNNINDSKESLLDMYEKITSKSKKKGG